MAMRCINMPGTPVTEADLATGGQVLREFEIADEVRVSEDATFLAPVVNQLIASRRKFYLIHLPDGGGWVLRRHRPTGAFHGNPPEFDHGTHTGRLERQPAEPIATSGHSEQG